MTFSPEDVIEIQNETEVGFKQSTILSEHESQILNYGQLYQPQPRQEIQLSPEFHDDRRTLAVNAKLPRHSKLQEVVPQLGQYLLKDGRVIVRTVTDSPDSDLWITGDFNDWVYPDDRYKLQVDPDNPYIRYIILPASSDSEGYHLQYYALVRKAQASGFVYLVTDPASNLVSSPTFYRRFIEGTPRDNPKRPLGEEQVMPLSVFWFPPDEQHREEIDPTKLPYRTNIGETAYVALTTDLTTYIARFTCQNPDSVFYGSIGREHINETYRFVSECNVPQHIRDEGYSAVQFYPNVSNQTHADQRRPEDKVVDWRYWYLVRQYMTAGQSDQGTPSEYRQMLEAFNEAGLSVVVDFVFAHSAQPYINGQFYLEVLMGLSGQGFLSSYGTEWGTLRPKFDNPGFRLLAREALIKFFYEGYEGVRVDNVDGMSWVPGGESLLRELGWEMMLRDPNFQIIGEMYTMFDDRVISPLYPLGRNRRGSGLTVGYTDHFNANLSKIIRKNPDEYSLHQIAEYWRNPWRWLDVHGWRPDDLNNPRDYDDIHGQYPASKLGSDPKHLKGKLMAFTALKLSAGSYYIDAVQVFTLQQGNLESNGAVAWENLNDPEVQKFHEAIVDFRSLIASDAYHAWYNQRDRHEKLLDDENKVVAFEYGQPDPNQRRIIIINLTDSTYPNYTLEEAGFPETSFEVVYRSGINEYLGALPNSAIGETVNVAFSEINLTSNPDDPQLTIDPDRISLEAETTTHLKVQGDLNVNYQAVIAIPRGLQPYEVVVMDQVKKNYDLYENLQKISENSKIDADF